MLCQDRVQRTQSVADRRGRVVIVRAETRVAGRACPMRFKGSATAVVLMLGIALLVAGCARFTYDQTPTSVSYVTPPPTVILTMTSTPLQAEPQDEALLPTPTVPGPTLLRVDPPVVNLAVGETRLVQVWLDNVEQLHSIELHIGFEPGYVRIEDADPDTEGVQIRAGVIPMPAHVVRNETDNDAGLIVYHVAQAPGTPVSGSGMVASFMARALAEGGSPLKLSVVNLRDAEGQSLPAPQQVSGLVVIGTGGGVPGPTAVATAPVPDSPASTVDTYHTVQPGENLFRIALRYGTTVDAIVAVNNLPDASSVQAGQVLLIPASQPASTSTYVVQPGDTLYSIARRFDTTVETLAALNGIAPPYTLEVGQVLIVTP
jgi:LysM repeat protein